MKQPNPKPGKQNVFPEIKGKILDMIEQRRQEGIATYGTELQTHNGRDVLRDAFEDCLDCLIYLGQALMERDGGLDIF